MSQPAGHHHRHHDAPAPSGVVAAPPALIVSRATPRLPPAPTATPSAAAGRFNLAHLARAAAGAGAAPGGEATAPDHRFGMPAELRPFERRDAGGPIASLESKSSSSSSESKGSSPATLLGEPAPLLGGSGYGADASAGPLHSATSPTRGGASPHLPPEHQHEQQQQPLHRGSKALRPLPLYAAFSSGSTTGLPPNTSPGGLLEASTGALTTNGSTVGRSGSSSVVGHIMMAVEGVSASASSPRGGDLGASGSAAPSHHLLHHHYGQGRQSLIDHLDQHAAHHQRQASIPFSSGVPFVASGADAASAALSASLASPRAASSQAQPATARKKPSIGRASVASLSLADLVERRTPADDGACSTAAASMAANNHPPPLLSLAPMPIGTSVHASYASSAGDDGAAGAGLAISCTVNAEAPPASRRPRKGLGLSLNEEVLSLAASRASRGVSQPPALPDAHAESGDLSGAGRSTEIAAAASQEGQGQVHYRRPSSGLRLSDHLCTSRDGSGARRNNQSSADDVEEGGGGMTALEEAMAAMEAESRAMALRSARTGAAPRAQQAPDDSLVPPTPVGSPGIRGANMSAFRHGRQSIGGAGADASPGPREVREVVGVTASFKGWEMMPTSPATPTSAPPFAVSSVAGELPAPVHVSPPDDDMASPTPIGRSKQRERRRSGNVESGQPPGGSDRTDVFTVSPPTPAARAMPRQAASPPLPPLLGPHGTQAPTRSPKLSPAAAAVASPHVLPPLDVSPARLLGNSGLSPALRSTPRATGGATANTTSGLPILRLPQVPSASAAPKVGLQSTPRTGRAPAGHTPKVTAGFLLPSLDHAEDEAVLLAASATQVSDGEAGSIRLDDATVAAATAYDAPPPRKSHSKKRRKQLAAGDAGVDSIEAPTAARGSIKVLSYNLLAPRYAASDKYAHCPFVFLDQQYRFASAARQIADAAADLVLLQELPTGLAAPLSDFSSALRVGKIGALFHVPVSGRDVTPWPVLPPAYRVQKPLLPDDDGTSSGAPPPRFVGSAAQTFYNFAALSLVPYMDSVIAGERPQPPAGPHPPVPCYWTTDAAAASGASSPSWVPVPETPEAVDVGGGGGGALTFAGVANSLTMTGLDDQADVTGLGIVSPSDPRDEGAAAAFAATPQSVTGDMHVQPPLALRTNTWTPSSARSGNAPSALALFDPAAPTPTANQQAVGGSDGTAVDPNRSALPLNFATPIGNAALAAGGVAFDTSFTALVGPQYRQLLPTHNPPLEGVAIGWNPERFELLERVPLYFNFLAHRAQGEVFEGVPDTVATTSDTSAPLTAGQAHKLCIKSHNVAAIVVLRDRGTASTAQGAEVERIVVAGTLHCFYMRSRPDCQRWQVARLIEAMRGLREKYLRAAAKGGGEKSGGPRISVSLVFGGDLNAEEGSLPLDFVQDPALHAPSPVVPVPAAAARRSPTPPPGAPGGWAHEQRQAATARGLSSSTAAAASVPEVHHAETYSPRQLRRQPRAAASQCWTGMESSPPACTPPAGAWRGRRGSRTPLEAFTGPGDGAVVEGAAASPPQRAATSEMAKRVSTVSALAASAPALQAPPGSASHGRRWQPVHTSHTPADASSSPVLPHHDSSERRCAPSAGDTAHHVECGGPTATTGEIGITPEAPRGSGRKRGADGEVPLSPCRVAAGNDHRRGLCLVSAYKAARYYGNHPRHVSATDPEQVGARGVIDHLFFEPDHWRLRAVGMLAPAGEVPNAVDPSDHFPVSMWLEPRTN